MHGTCMYNIESGCGELDFQAYAKGKFANLIQVHVPSKFRTI